MQFLPAFISGLIFGLGLLISGMANPLKVQNFLDVFGNWDPSLAFVMGGAIAVTMPGYYLLRKRARPLVAPTFHWPGRTDLDSRLITGSAIFGIGWGLGGFCPGPAITALPFMATGTFVFVAAMLAGFMLAKIISRRNTNSAGTQVSSTLAN
jgi:uncharacterized membrane protein YedE/YeeE